MNLASVDSLDLVELVIFLEEVFGITVLDSDSPTFDSPDQAVDWLEPQLANERPNQRATAILKDIAKRDNRPDLVADPTGCWRREQIQATVRHIMQRWRIPNGGG